MPGGGGRHTTPTHNCYKNSNIFSSKQKQLLWLTLGKPNLGLKLGSFPITVEQSPVKPSHRFLSPPSTTTSTMGCPRLTAKEMFYPSLLSNNLDERPEQEVTHVPGTLSDVTTENMFLILWYNSVSYFYKQCGESRVISLPLFYFFPRLF